MLNIWSTAKEVAWVLGLVKNKSLLEDEDIEYELTEDEADQDFTIPFAGDPFATLSYKEVVGGLAITLKSTARGIEDTTYIFSEEDLEKDALSASQAFCAVYNKLIPSDLFDPKGFNEWLETIHQDYRASMMLYYAKKREAQYSIYQFLRTMYNIDKTKLQGVACKFADLPDQDMALN